ncbi:hypothetical protein N9Q04_03940 [Burkholderiales bacterium]|nr:hypothetical protein [Burkholderiales bacterium]
MNKQYLLAILYLSFWLFPVGASWLVAASGKYFSYTSQHWQFKNIELVGTILIISMVLVMLAVHVVIKYCSNRKMENKRGLPLPITNVQLSCLAVIAVFSGIGLFLSFEGTIFQHAYGGATVIWLGNGAWSIFFIIAVFLISISIIERYSIYLANIFTLISFSLILLSGSRIDYVSVQLAMMIYVLYIYEKNIKQRLFMFLGIGVWTVGVAHIIGFFRNAFWQGTKGIQEIEIRYLLESPVGTKADNVFTLSTFGDIGSSMFQIIGLLKEVPNRMVGLSDAFVVYATRMLPGPFFPDRPGGFSVQLPERIGNGATHALAEGYFVSGVIGVMLVSLMVGVLLGFSFIAGRNYRSTRSLSALIIFSFPWLLLIRGGWYHFFAFFKAAQVILLIYIILLAVNWMYRRFSVVLKSNA